MQIERRHSNKQKFFFGAVEFKFEPDMTVIIKNLAQKVDFRAKCRSKEDCCSICAGMVCTLQFFLQKSVLSFASCLSCEFRGGLIWNFHILFELLNPILLPQKRREAMESAMFEFIYSFKMSKISSLVHSSLSQEQG